MPQKSSSHAIAANRVLSGLGILLAFGIGLATPSGAVVRREIVLRLDPNVASPQVLEALPGLGPARVKAIVQAREQAPLRSIEDLDRRVKGIGPVTAKALEPFLRFDEPKPRG